MSVFNQSPFKADGDTYITLLAWSNFDSIAAIATTIVDEDEKETFQVQFINNEGELIPHSAISNESEAIVFDWQPNGRILAIGWADGLVSCWMVDGRSRPTSTFSNSSQHNDSITIIKWNPYGKRIITGDKKGQVCVWNVDPRGTLSITKGIYRKKGEVTAAVFCTVPNKSDPRKAELKHNFFFGTDRGQVIFADDLGHSQDVANMNTSIDTMLFFNERSRLVIITRSLLLTQFNVAEDGKVSRFQQVKLSIAGDVADKGIKSVVWASPGLLAAATQEKFVRLLDIATDESYNLSLSAIGDIIDRNDRVVCVSFGPLDRYLAVGTQMGVVAMWKFNGPLRDVRGSRAASTPTSASDWELIFKTTIGGPVQQLCWHGGQGTVAAVTDDGVVVLTETIMHCKQCGELSVIQTGSHELSLNVGGSQEHWAENTGMLVKGLTVGSTCFAIWGGKSARVYRVDGILSNVEPLEPFTTAGTALAICDTSHDIVEEALFIAEDGMVKICNFQGVQKGTITFSETEGSPEHLDINGQFLAIITNKGFIKILDITKPKNPKNAGQSGNAGRFSELISNGSNKNSINTPSTQVRCIKVNSKGNRVAILADHVEGSLQVRHPDSNLYVYDHDRGNINSFDFSILKRRPISIFWDDCDDRMLSCEAQKNRVTAILPGADLSKKLGGELSKNLQEDKDTDDKEVAEVEVVIFFATKENGLLMQDSFPRKAPFGNMLGFAVPRLYFRDAPVTTTDEEIESKGEELATNKAKVYSKVMRDFIGVEDITDQVKTALLDFSYNLTLGKLDEAYRAVKTIGSVTIWENMAQMCVKTKRLDVAEVCLGNMGHARGAAAVREAKKEGSLETSVGVLAIQLGLYDDAARLFREAGRYDLLNRLFQSAGLWEKAINIATSTDRIHLKTTHYHYAKHLESIGDIANAITHFEKSDTSRTEVPRMLFSLQRIDDLEDYIHKSDDTTLLKWWASYLESNERYDKARKYYSKAGDFLSLVRIACFKGDLNKAAEIVQEAGDRAAAYHFARQLENQGEYQEAINFYAQSGCYNHSIRLSRAYNLDSELMKFALKSTSSLMLDCASHFEEKGELEKAVELYHKGGDLPRALDLCFRAGEDKTGKRSGVFDMLNSIAQDLGANTSPTTLARCAEFLMLHKQFDKAIELYVMAKRYLQAISMCMEQRVNISDEMVEKLTPPDTIDPAERKELLKELAKALKKQGSFALASKKYTQSGDRVRAIKCLVRSGDTKAVIQFASISRTAEIYKLAANYLQQMNWRESVDIMKSIILFYTKAKAFEQLAGFYDSCAQVEIDEYRDYEKAIGALKEALKHLSKAPTSRSITDMSDSIEKRIILVEKFVQARRAAVREPDTMVAICEALLQEPLLEEAIRAGDCLAMLVEHFHSKGRMREAYTYLQEMEERRIAVHPYVDAEVLSEVYKAVGGGPGRSTNNNNNNNNNDVDRMEFKQGERNNNDEDDEDMIDEDIDEEIAEEEEDEDYSAAIKSNPNLSKSNGRPKSAAARK